MFGEAWRHLKEEKYFYALLLLLGVMAICLLSFTGNEVIKEVSKALIVAVTLAATVDTYLKSRLTKEIVKKVSPYVMARDLPSELQREVNTICELKAYRRNFELTYEIEKFEGDDGALKVTCFVSYDVVNITDEYIPCDHYVWVERVAGVRHLDKQIGIVGAEGICDLERNPLKYDREVSLEEVREVGGGLEWINHILLPPKEHPPAKFWQTSYQVFPFERYEPFITTVAVVGVKVRISHPEWLEVGVFFEHRLEKDCVPRREGTRIVWEFKHALLPYSTVAVTWKPKKAASSIEHV